MKRLPWIALPLLFLTACEDRQPLAPEITSPAPRQNAAALVGQDLAPEFVKVKVGTLSRYGYIPTSEITDINGRGWVVGHSSGLAFLWTPETGIRELPGLVPNASTRAYALNESGWVTGESSSPTGYAHAVLWSPEGVVKDLGALPAGATTMGLAINDRGDVVGEVVNGSGQWNTFVYTAGTGMQLLADVAAVERNCSPTGLNAHGTIALSCNGYLTGMRGFRYAGGQLSKIVAEGTRGNTAGMSPGGIISGTWTVGSGINAAYWTPSGGTYVVPRQDSRGHDVNDRGELVGDLPYSGGRRAFLASAAFGVVDLPTAGNGYSRARAINAIGDVAGAEYFGYLGLAEGTIWRRVVRPAMDVQPAKISLSLSSLVTVYLLSGDGFDAAQASAATARLYPGGTGAGAAVATRNGAPLTSLRDVNGDGRADRVLTFLVSELRAAGLTTATTSWTLGDLSPAPRPYRAADLAPPSVLP